MQWVKARVGFLPAKTYFYRDGVKNLVFTFFYRFLPAKTGRNSTKMGRNYNISLLIGSNLVFGQHVGKSLQNQMSKHTFLFTLPIMNNCRHSAVVINFVQTYFYMEIFLNTSKCCLWVKTLKELSTFRQLPASSWS